MERRKSKMIVFFAKQSIDSYWGAFLILLITISMLRCLAADLCTSSCTSYERRLVFVREGNTKRLPYELSANLIIASEALRNQGQSVVGQAKYRPNVKGRRNRQVICDTAHNLVFSSGLVTV